MALRVWFNHWFSTAYHLINLLKNNEDDRKFILYGTNRLKEALMLQACDYKGVEPVFDNQNDYLNYCVDFCKTNDIQVFIPRHGLDIISKNLSRFDSVGTKVLVSSDYNLLSILKDKAEFYKHCENSKIFDIPEYYVAETLDEFKVAYSRLKDKGRVCIKPVISEGATGFRVIDNRAKSIENLLSPVNHKISYDEVCNILGSKESFEKIMVMEYLEEAEYSIDCLAMNGQMYAAIPRKKEGNRIRVIEENRDLIELAHKFNQYYKMPYIYNIQVKYNKGTPKLLEVNPRMSGGCHLSCLAGVNLPYLAVKLLLGEKINIGDVKYGLIVSQLETEVVLKL